MPKLLRLSAERKRKLLKLLEAGQTLTAAAELVGVSFQTVLAHCKRDSRLDEQVRAAMEVQVELVQNALYVAGLNGSVQAMILFLVNRSRHMPPRERWYYRQHVPGSVQVEPGRQEGKPLFAISDDALVQIVYAGVSSTGQEIAKRDSDSARIGQAGHEDEDVRSDPLSQPVLKIRRCATHHQTDADPESLSRCSACA
jgi:hypothetical protein